MLQDRPYMRDDYPKHGRTALTWLLCAIASGFILEAIFKRMFESDAFINWFELTSGGLRRGYAWQLLTHSFVHPLSGLLSVMQVGLNMLCLYYLGREIETLLGAPRFLILYFGAALISAGCWLTLHQQDTGSLVGTWPAILAFLTLYALLNPNQEKRLLVLFIPMTLKPKYIAWGLLVINTTALALGEWRGASLPLQYAPSAHLGGMLTGLLYYLFVHLREWRNPDGRTRIELPKWLRRKQKAGASTTTKYTVNLTTTPRENLKSEIDRILDKINSQGFDSLTPEEKRLLDDARDQLGRNR